MNITRLFDIINSIAIFQLVFFSIYLFSKGNKIPSTIFLKIYLLSQLLGYANYISYYHDYNLLRPLLLISMPCTLIWSPTLCFYVRSRLYKNFIPSWKLMPHAIPAIIIMFFILSLILSNENFYERKEELRQVSYYFIKIQILIYNLYTLYIIGRYRREIKLVTSANEKQKLNWLSFIIYGYAINSLAGLVVHVIPGLSDPGWGYFIFWIFINLFFFKSILHPDQFLGVDERKQMPVRLDSNKSNKYFREIEEIIESKQLFLDPDLSLHNVAEAMKLPDRIISQSIKQQVAFNFADYINSKRINYAKEVLRTTTKAEKNVLEILYEAGFNSKSVFNTQFKKHTGLSPTMYRKMKSAIHT